MRLYNILQPLLLVLVISTFAGCKKDLGNYEYNDLPDFYVESSGQQTSFEVPYGIGQLRVNPQVVYSGEQDLSYRWTLYGTTGTIDTLSADLLLDMSLTKPLGKYTLEFCATEEATGRMTFQKYAIEVTPPYASGFMVGHERDGTFDIDFIRSPLLNPIFPDTVYRDIYFRANGRRMSGSPVSLGQYNTYSVWPATIVVASNEEVSIVEAGTFAEYHNYNDLFFSDDIRPLPGDKPKATGGSSIAASLIIGNKIYGQASKFTTLQFNGLYPEPDEKGLEISAVAFDPFIYDEKNYRFLNVGTTGTLTLYPKTNNTSARFSLDSIGSKELLFLKTGHNMGSGTVRYALFKDKEDESSRYLYLINFTTSLTTSPDRGLVNVSAAPNLRQAVAYETLTNVPVVYYATETAIHRITVSVDGVNFQHSMAGYDAPSGEVITSIKWYSNDLLFVAAWNTAAQQGSVYLLPVSFDGTLGTPLQTWTGFDGKITWMGTKER